MTSENANLNNLAATPPPPFKPETFVTGKKKPGRKPFTDEIKQEIKNRILSGIPEGETSYTFHIATLSQQLKAPLSEIKSIVLDICAEKQWVPNIDYAPTPVSVNYRGKSLTIGKRQLIAALKNANQDPKLLDSVSKFNVSFSSQDDKNYFFLVASE